MTKIKNHPETAQKSSACATAGGRESCADPRFAEALAAIKSLEEGGYEAMLAGGCVRDRILGVVPKDYDIATTGEPNAVQRLFAAQGRKVIPTGIDHGTVTLVGGCGQYEITTLRRDVLTDGRRAVVAFSKSFAEDAERRDFTINAMFEDSSGKVHDFFEGRLHLKERRLVFVGDASRRIKEDYLRILRFFRFWARLEFQPDAGALVAIGELSGGLAHISQERISSELLQILAAPKPGNVLDSMQRSGVWPVIMPEAQLSPEAFRILDEISGRQNASSDELAVFRLAVIMAGLSADKAVQTGQRLRLPTSDIHKLRCFRDSLDKIHDEALLHDVAACMRFVDFVEESAGAGGFERIFSEAIRAYLAGSHQSFRKSLPAVDRIITIEKEHGDLRRRPMPLNGKSLMRELSIKPGPQLKVILEELKDRFRRQEWATSSEGTLVASRILLRKNPASK